jgi:hypothetical protein
MQSIEEMRESIIQVKLEISKYKELSNNKPDNWRLGKDIYHPELVEERDAFSKVCKIVDEQIKSNNIIISQLKNSGEQDMKILELLESDNQDLIQFTIEFFK